MAKKSATKSPSSKKTTTKKQAQEKKTKAPKKKPAAKSPAKAKSTQKPKVAPKAGAAKTGAATPKTITVKELLQKRFEAWKPQSSFKPEPDEVYEQGFSAPSFFPDQQKTDADKLQELLLKRFDQEPSAAQETEMPAQKEAAPAKKEAAPEPEPAPPAPKAEAPAPAKEVPAQKAAAPPAPKEPKVSPAKTESAAAPPAPPKPKTPAAPAAPPGSGAPAQEQEGVKKTPTQPPVKAEAAVPPPPIPTEEKPSMNRTGIAVIAGFALLFLILLGVSYSNTSNYYIKPAKRGVEIWKGKFAPLGSELLLQLPGFEPPAEIKEVYAQEEVYPLIARHFLNQADQLVNTDAVPDLAAIREELQKANEYATGDLKESIQSRLEGLDLIVLLYKAEVTSAVGTPEALQNALGYLEKAEDLAADEFQEEMIEKKTAAVKNQLTEATAETSPAGPEADQLTEAAPASPQVSEPSAGHEEAASPVPQTTGDAH